MRLRIISIRVAIVLLLVVPLYVLTFALYACHGNAGCAALATPDVLDSLLGIPLYPNFMSATGGPPDNVPVTLHPAPSILHIAVLVIALVAIWSSFTPSHKPRP